MICKTGYKKATHGKIFCQADGTWTNETCKPKGKSDGPHPHVPAPTPELMPVHSEGTCTNETCKPKGQVKGPHPHVPSPHTQTYACPHIALVNKQIQRSQIRSRSGPILSWRLITVILLPSAESFKKGCCQLQEKVCARITG